MSNKNIYSSLEEPYSDFVTVRWCRETLEEQIYSMSHISDTVKRTVIDVTVQEAESVLNSGVTDAEALGVVGAVNEIVTLVECGCIVGETTQVHERVAIEENSFEDFVRNNFEKQVDDISSDISSR